MKKITAIFLLILFLISNSGIAVAAHYCGGKLSSIVFFKLQNHPCKCGKKAMKKDCCKDKVVIIKGENNAIKSQIVVKITCIDNIVSVTNTYNILPIFTTKNIFFSFLKVPIFKPKTPIYLLDGVFLI